MNIYWLEDPSLAVTLPIAEDDPLAWGKTSPLNLWILGAIVAGMPQVAQASPLDFGLPAYHSPKPSASEVVATSTKNAAQASLSQPFAKRLQRLAPSATLGPLARQSDRLAVLFAGGSDSLVAWAVGAAEGTRTPTGGYTKAYEGHRDPGNGVWNLGTFSYQHGARSPAEADDRQLQRLSQQAKTLAQQAQAKDLALDWPDLLNGIDLANQAPEAALDHGGYLDRLQEARSQGLTGETAIVWARTYAFIEPKTGRWNAPGLGNDRELIWRDQKRRAQAIAAALEAWENSPQLNAGWVAEKPRPAQNLVNQTETIAAGSPPDPAPEKPLLSPPGLQFETEPEDEPLDPTPTETTSHLPEQADQPAHDLTEAIISFDLDTPPEILVSGLSPSR